MDKAVFRFTGGKLINCYWDYKRSPDSPMTPVVREVKNQKEMMNTPIEELAEKINYCIENHIDLSKVSLRLKINGVEGEISIPNPEVDFIWIRDKPGKKSKYSGLELVFSSKKGE